VTSAFIIDIQQNITEDFSETSARLLRSSFRTPKPSPLENTSIPHPLSDKSYVGIRCTTYTSLAVSVLAACLAMLGKQWLNRYDQIEMRGTLIQRSRHRHRKMAGMAAWYFDITMDAPPSCFRSGFSCFVMGFRGTCGTSIKRWRR
jgi:hypothetical protein